MIQYLIISSGYFYLIPFYREKVREENQPEKAKNEENKMHDNSAVNYSEEKGLLKDSICPVWKLRLEDSQNVIRVNACDHVMHEECLNEIPIEKTEDNLERWAECHITLPNTA